MTIKRLHIVGFVVALPLLATVGPVIALRWIDPPITSFMLHQRSDAHRRGDRSWTLHYEWIDLESISPHTAIAMVAAEDQRFPQHHGFDLAAIAQARRAHEDGRRLRGASTISQQVAKNLFLWPERSWVRKGIEAYFTVLIELLWPKRRILETYLNVAEFGPGIYGVGAASEQFFGRDPARLEPAQAALLAAVLPDPRRLRADRPSDYVMERRDWILRQMKQLGGADRLRGILSG